MVLLLTSSNVLIPTFGGDPDPVLLSPTADFLGTAHLASKSTRWKRVIVMSPDGTSSLARPSFLMLSIESAYQNCASCYQWKSYTSEAFRLSGTLRRHKALYEEPGFQPINIVMARQVDGLRQVKWGGT